MIVRFDSKKLQTNTTTNIGVESEGNKDRSAVSEVEMLVAEARRHSGAVREGAAEDDKESEELRDMVIKESEEEQEDQEPGPELTPEGKAEADKILAEKSAGRSSQESPIPKKEEKSS
jgi:hypothetical protein